MRHRYILVLGALVLGWGLIAPSRGAVVLTLSDGRTVEGQALERTEDGHYVLIREDGGRLVLPQAVVTKVTYRSERRDAPDDRPGQDRRIVREPLDRGRPRQLAGNPLPEDSLDNQPRRLVGPEIRTPTVEQQTQVFGEPAGFRRDVVDNRWEPTSDWDDDPARTNNWNPARWSRGPVDSTWQPQSGFTQRDVLEGRRSTFRRSIIDSTWQPTDGFGSSRN